MSGWLLLLVVLAGAILVWCILAKISWKLDQKRGRTKPFRDLDILFGPTWLFLQAVFFLVELGLPKAERAPPVKRN